ncbi:Zinc finger protein ZAT4 [Bienertia sinuspersici]
MKHVCKFCKKSFPCGRSLGGHIRSHLPKPGYELRENPKKTWRVANGHEDVLLNSTTFSSSSTETENPKSSKMNQNQSKRSNFVRNNSHSSVSEVVEAEHQQEEVVVAMCLIMLSQDMGSWGNISSTSFTATATESFENNSLHHGLKLKGVEVSANGLCSNDKNNKSSSESKRKREKVQSKESDFTATDHAEKSAKVESVASGKRKFIGQSTASVNVKKCSKLEEYEVSENGVSSYDQKNKENDQYELDSELCNDMSKISDYKRSKFECTTCNKVFHSYQALGGHRASHKKLMGSGKCSSTTLPKLEAEIDTDDVDQSTEVQQQTQSQQKQELVANNMVIGSSSSSSKKVVQKHECPIFQINSQNSRIVDVVERLSSSENRDLLDLNFPPAQDETATTVSSSNSLVGFTKPYWCVESSHKHEPLLGLISN